MLIKLAYKPHSVPVHNTGGGHLSGRTIAGPLARSTRVSVGTSSPDDHARLKCLRFRAVKQPCMPSTLLDLAPGGVCRASRISAAAGGLLHHRFTLTGQEPKLQPAIRLSVALSVGLPRPAVSRHRALWSADFPRPGIPGRDHPASLIV
jgi:hypothetical protein